MKYFAKYHENTIVFFFFFKTIKRQFWSIMRHDRFYIITTWRRSRKIIDVELT